MRITWSEPALANLEAIHEYIGRDAPDRADRFIRRLLTAAEPLRDFPRMGRTVPEGDGRHREIILDPYRIIYRAEADEIFIVTVIHGSRDLAELWKDLVRSELEEDADDLKSFAERRDEPTISFAEVVQDLRRRGRI